MPHLVSLPVVRGDGYAKFLNSEDADLVARWIDAENRPGRGVYRIMNPLVDGAKVHSKENSRGVRYIYVDLDGKDIEESVEEVERRLRVLPLKPTWITRSGHGWHVVWELKECADHENGDYERAVALQAKIIEWLAADRLVRPWTILRLPGTINYKQEPYVPCEIMLTGSPVDLTEIETMCSLVEGRVLFTRKAKPEDGAEHDQYFDPGYKEPVNVEERLQNMITKAPGIAPSARRSCKSLRP